MDQKTSSRPSPYDALALFSGGLDSIVSAKTIEAQGLSVLGVHFYTPFFGHPDRVATWRKDYDLDIVAVDVSDAYLHMLRVGAPHGFGKNMNPCVDCKVLLLSVAREMLAEYGAKFLISGEVVGQRPMSQRPDALNTIRKDAEVRDLLLRPLSAKCLDPTPMETSGLVDREELHDFYGRGRKGQMELAKRFGVDPIPGPAGGCKLTEPEACSRFSAVVRHIPDAHANDFWLSGAGRQFWSGDHWLVIGRDEASNEVMEGLAGRGAGRTDVLIDLVDLPGPLGLARQLTAQPWSDELLADAAAFVASYSPRARQQVEQGGVDVPDGGDGGDASTVRVALIPVGADGTQGEPHVIDVAPQRDTTAAWSQPQMADYKQWVKQMHARKMETDKTGTVPAWFSA